MKVTIREAKVEVKTGTSKRSGKPYTLRQQSATFESEAERRVCMLILGDEQQPHEPGVYEIDAARAFTVSQYGDVELVRVLPLRKVGELPASRRAA